MDETKATYGTVRELAVTLINGDYEKTFKLPNPKTAGAIGEYATTFANLATNNDTAVIGVDTSDGIVTPTGVRIDIIETTRTNVYEN